MKRKGEEGRLLAYISVKRDMGFAAELGRAESVLEAFSDWRKNRWHQKVKQAESGGDKPQTKRKRKNVNL